MSTITLLQLPYQANIKGNFSKTTKFTPKKAINYDNYEQNINYGFSNYKETFDITFINLSTYPQIKFDLYGDLSSTDIVSINLSNFTSKTTTQQPSIVAKCTTTCTSFELLSAIRHALTNTVQNPFTLNNKTYNIVSNIKLFAPIVVVTLNSITITLQCDLLSIPTLNNDSTLSNSVVIKPYISTDITSLINVFKNVRKDVAYQFNTFPDPTQPTIVKQPNSWDTTTVKTTKGLIHTLSCSLTSFY